MRLRTRVVDGRVVVGAAAVRERPRGRAWERIRQAVAARDRWECQLCGKPIGRALRRPNPMALEVHHVVSVEAGGTDELANLQAAHADCHRRCRR